MPTPKGQKLSMEHRKNISETCKKNGVGKWMKGRKLSQNTIEKQREKKVGRFVSVETREKIRKSQIGVPRFHMRGEKHPRYISDRSKLQRYGTDNQDRRSSMYREWRKKVWLRDNFKCKIANPDCKGRIEAHHILGYTEYPELRFDINNGITLCHHHHPQKRKDEMELSPYFQQLVAEMN